jgi:hypothetical protein
MHGRLEDGRILRLFNVIDDFNREALGIEVDFLLPSDRVIRPLGLSVGLLFSPYGKCGSRYHNRCRSYKQQCARTNSGQWLKIFETNRREAV